MDAPVQAMAAVAPAPAGIMPGRAFHVGAGQKGRPPKSSYEQRYRAEVAFTTGNGLHHHCLGVNKPEHAEPTVNSQAEPDGSCFRRARHDMLSHGAALR